jgi:hypothetical protein
MKNLVGLLIAFIPAFAHADKDLERSGTWDCKKDPVAHIGNGAGKYTFIGNCKMIEVGGGKNTITIASVETLDVGGAGNTINVGTVGTIDVGGDGNKITWKKAKTGDKPILKGQPERNTIAQGK